MTIWTKSFGIATGERVLATFLAVFVAVITNGAVEFGASNGFDITRINWMLGVKLASGAALISLVKCLLANLATKDGPSATHAEQVVPPLPAPAQT
jgi:hypothetical protein